MVYIDFIYFYLRLHCIQSARPHFPEPVPPVLGNHPEVVHGPAVDPERLPLKDKLPALKGQRPCASVYLRHCQTTYNKSAKLQAI